MSSIFMNWWLSEIHIRPKLYNPLDYYLVVAFQAIVQITIDFKYIVQLE